jgi:hypothetical protein
MVGQTAAVPGGREVREEGSSRLILRARWRLAAIHQQRSWSTIAVDLEDALCVPVLRQVAIRAPTFSTVITPRV